MTVIDRYLLRQFTKALVVFFVSITGLYIVVDAFGNLEEFIDYGEQQGSLFAVLAAYYGARVLAFFDLTNGLLTLIAAMFTITWLQKSREITALMAAGISKWRIVTPVVAAVAVVALAAMVNREVVLPRFRDKLSRNAQNWKGENAKQLQPRYDNQTDILMGGKHTFANEQRIEQPCFRMPPRFEYFDTQLVAENAYYKEPIGDQPGGYLLDGVSQPADVHERTSLLEVQKPVILCPGDTEWLEDNQCFVVSDLSFEHLEGGSSWRQFSSTPALISALRSPCLDFGPDVRVTVHSRFVKPVLDVTLLFLGLPLVLSRRDRNVFLAVGLSLLIVGAFFVVTMACHALGANFILSPSMAAWAPVIIFVPIAVWMAESLRT